MYIYNIPPYRELPFGGDFNGRLYRYIVGFGTLASSSFRFLSSCFQLMNMRKSDRIYGRMVLSVIESLAGASLVHQELCHTSPDSKSTYTEKTREQIEAIDIHNFWSTHANSFLVSTTQLPLILLVTTKGRKRPKIAHYESK